MSGQTIAIVVGAYLVMLVLIVCLLAAARRGDDRLRSAHELEREQEENERRDVA